MWIWFVGFNSGWSVNPIRFTNFMETIKLIQRLWLTGEEDGKCGIFAKINNSVSVITDEYIIS